MSTSIRLGKYHFTVRNFQNRFVLLRDEHAHGLAVVGKAILDHSFSFVQEVIATEREIYLKLKDQFKVEDLKQLTKVRMPAKQKWRTIRLPVCFELGGDWEEVEKYTGQSRLALLRKLTALELSVAMFGFMPGFVYMNGLPKKLQVPRKANPSHQIPANSLAMGGPYLGIYSLPSPAGWHQIGELPFSILNWGSLPPLHLEATDRIRLEAIDQATYRKIQQQKTTFLEYNGLA